MKKQNKKHNRNQNQSSYRVVSLFVLLSIVGFGGIVYVLSFFLNKTMSAGMENEIGDSAVAAQLVNTLLSMQGLTLAIVGIAVAWTAIVVALVTIYQQQRNIVNEEQLENAIDSAKKLEASIAQTFSMLILQSMDDEYSFGARTMFLKESEHANAVSQDNPVWFYFYLTRLFEADRALNFAHTKEEKESLYNSITDNADVLLESAPVSESIKYIICMKAVNAAYQHCRLVEPTGKLQAAQFIMKAQGYLDNRKTLLSHQSLLETEEHDRYGHAQNLQGLVYLWRARIGGECLKNKFKSESAISLLKKAEVKFELAVQLAIQSNANHKVAFLNHLAVAQMNIGFCEQKAGHFAEAEDAYIKAENTLNLLCDLQGDYGKALLNKGHSHLCRAEVTMKLRQMPYLKEDFEQAMSVLAQMEDAEKETAKHELKLAEEELEKAKQADSNFENVYYLKVLVRIYQAKLDGMMPDADEMGKAMQCALQCCLSKVGATFQCENWLSQLTAEGTNAMLYIFRLYFSLLNKGDVVRALTEQIESREAAERNGFQ